MLAIATSALTHSVIDASDRFSIANGVEDEFTESGDAVYRNVKLRGLPTAAETGSEKLYDEQNADAQKDDPVDLDPNDDTGA